MALLALLVLGLAIRLYDLTDPPLDFHETRQLGSAVVARGMYYEMLPGAPEGQRALAQELRSSVPVYEPHILERLVALTYLAAGGEHLWFARVYSSAFWVLGALGLYALAASAGSPLGGLVAVGYYLLLPYAVVASRSFQPDPMMTALVVFGLLMLHRWGQTPTMGRAVAAGAVVGAAILVKAVAVFPLLGALGGVALGVRGLKRGARDPQLWTMGALALLPAAFHNLVLTTDRSAGLFTYWVVALRGLLREPSFYVRWAQQAENVVGAGWLVMGLVGALVLPPKTARPAVVGAWVGYGLYGLALPYQIMTHDYYHLMLIPLVAIGLWPLSAASLAPLDRDRRVWRAAAFGVAALAAGMFAWKAIGTLADADYRPEAAGWRRMGESLPRDGEIVALTHSYGARLQYYAWLNTRLWPYADDMALGSLAGGGEFDFKAEFTRRTEGARYFLITHFAELDRQGDLKDYLYSHYSVFDEGEGYLIFDLSTERGASIP